MNTHFLKVLFITSLMFAGITNSNAAFTQYSNEAAWLAATGGTTGTETFNSFSTDTSFQNTTVSANNMQISGVPGSNGSITNTVDVASFAFNGFYDLDGSTYLLGDLRDQQTIRIDFGNSVSAWGATFSGISDTSSRNTQISVFNSSNTLLGVVNTSSVTNTDVGFYGFNFNANESAAYLIFQNTTSANDVFGIDNIGFVTANVSVPESGSLYLLAFGLLGLFATSRKQT